MAEPEAETAAAPARPGELERSAHRLEFLVNAGKTLALSLDYETTLRHVAELAVPAVADWCIVDLVEEGTRTRPLAFAHADPGMIEILRKLREDYPYRVDATIGVSSVLRSREPELLPDVTPGLLRDTAHDDEHLRILESLKIRSRMVVPLCARQQVLGALTLVSSREDRRYDGEDVKMAEELAARAALAIDNARLVAGLASAKQEAERALAVAEEASAAKSQFLATMSHELRTPLNAIDGYAELMELGVHGELNEPQLEAIRRLRSAQKRLLSLINDVLHFAKLESGQVMFDLQDVAVSELVDSVEPLLAPQLDRKRLELMIGSIPPDLMVHADPGKAGQILLNLLANAVKFTPAKGRIVLDTEARSAFARIRVRDTGPGIAEDRLSAIFEPFVQVTGGMVRDQGGIGLGLAISRDLARAMGGDLLVDSHLGYGSTFTLLLPLAGGGAGPDSAEE